MKKEQVFRVVTILVVFISAMLLVLMPEILSAAQIKVERDSWVCKISEVSYYFKASGPRTQIKIIVEKGDCPSKIANRLNKEKYCPKSTISWQILYRENKEVIDLPGRIMSGSKIFYCYE